VVKQQKSKTLDKHQLCSIVGIANYLKRELTMNAIDNKQDVLDSRDLIALYAKLAEKRDDLQTAVDDAKDALENATDKLDAAADLDAAQNAFHDWERDDRDELESLMEFCNDGEEYCSSWRYGSVLIRDSYFEDYARYLAEDLQTVSNDVSWPGNCIDWEQAARELQQGYTSLEWSGVIYWIR
jgi:hypothetical protein